MSQKTTSFSSASDACFLSSLAEGEADLRDLRSGLGVLSSDESRLLLDPEPEPEDDSESEPALDLREESRTEEEIWNQTWTCCRHHRPHRSPVS